MRINTEQYRISDNCKFGYPQSICSTYMRGNSVCINNSFRGRVGYSGALKLKSVKVGVQPDTKEVNAVVGVVVVVSTIVVAIVKGTVVLVAVLMV